MLGIPSTPIPGLSGIQGEKFGWQVFRQPRASAAGLYRSLQSEISSAFQRFMSEPKSENHP